VFAVAPALFCAPDAWISARLCGARSWLHVQDFEVGAAGELGFLPSWAINAASILERRIFRRFDRVSSISGAMVRRLTEKGVEADRTRSLVNWVDTGRFRPDPAAGADFRRRWNIPPDVFMVLYSGNMGRKQGLDLLLKAASWLAGRKDVLFVLAGDGSERKTLESLAAGMENVRFFPLMPEEEMPSFLNAADLHLVLQRKGAADLVMPSKLTAILAVGGRFLVTAEPGTELARLAGELPSAVSLVPPENPEALAEAVTAMKAESTRGPDDASRRMAEERFGKEMVLGRLESELNALIVHGRKQC
jgi:colanic acid biosynthesis glycosyl transferase WcaI